MGGVIKMKKLCEKHDAYYDDEKDIWLESKCQNDCSFCNNRPDKPSQVNRRCERMRYCIFCKKPMFTSNFSIWIKGKNYDAHKKCAENDKKASEEKE